MDLQHTLNSGLKIPLIGFGTWLIKGKECSKCVKQAYDVGFRLFDSAAMYNNESAICKAFNEGKFDTSKTFVTTKLLPSDHGYEPAKRAFTQSWELLTNKERPIDLYLIHWPGTYHHCTVDQLKKTRRETWRALEEMYRKDRVRTIGVSNYEIRHLKEMMYEGESHVDILPAVNQIECHPKCNQKETVDFCQKNGIVVEAYMPFGEGEMLNDPYLEEFAKKLNKPKHGSVNIPQLILRWLIQRKIVPLPKTCRKERMVENMNIFDFELDEKEMEWMNNFESKYGHEKVDWDPTTIP